MTEPEKAIEEIQSRQRGRGEEEIILANLERNRAIAALYEDAKERYRWIDMYATMFPWLPEDIQRKKGESNSAILKELKGQP